MSEEDSADAKVYFTLVRCFEPVRVKLNPIKLETGGWQTQITTSAVKNTSSPGKRTYCNGRTCHSSMSVAIY